MPQHGIATVQDLAHGVEIWETSSTQQVLMKMEALKWNIMSKFQWENMETLDN